MQMPKKSSPALSEEYLKALYEGLKALTPLLNTSLTELERDIGLPSKTLTIGLKPDSNRNFTQKHYDILLKYAENNWEEELIAIFTKPFQEILDKEKNDGVSDGANEGVNEGVNKSEIKEINPLVELSEEELENKNFWIEEIKKAKSNLYFS